MKKGKRQDAIKEAYSKYKKELSEIKHKCRQDQKIKAEKIAQK